MFVYNNVNDEYIEGVTFANGQHVFRKNIVLVCYFHKRTMSENSPGGAGHGRDEDAVARRLGSHAYALASVVVNGTNTSRTLCLPRNHTNSTKNGTVNGSNATSLLEDCDPFETGTTQGSAASEDDDDDNKVKMKIFDGSFFLDDHAQSNVLYVLAC